MQSFVSVSELNKFYFSDEPLDGLKQASISMTWSLDVYLEKWGINNRFLSGTFIVIFKMIHF